MLRPLMYPFGEGIQGIGGSNIALRVCDSRMDFLPTPNGFPLKRKTISAVRPFTHSASIFEDPGAATLINRASISFLCSVVRTDSTYSSVCIIITQSHGNCKSFFKRMFHKIWGLSLIYLVQGVKTTRPPFAGEQTAFSMNALRQSVFAPEGLDRVLDPQKSIRNRHCSVLPGNLCINRIFAIKG